MNSVNVSVIGLGQMGSTLARLLLDAGHRVTVWNRSADKAAPLLSRGALSAASPLEAVRAGEVIIVCVHDYAASDAILRTPAIASALDGKLLVQLSTGSPAEARGAADWVRAHGGRYLDGAIQAAPGQMGRPDTPILLSGEEQVWIQHRSLLGALGGGWTWLGEDAGLAAAMDMATLSYIYGSMIGFLHGARIAESEGFRVDRFGELVAGIGPTFADFLKYEADVIQSGDFSVGESPLSISVEATARIARGARDSGIDDGIPRFMADLFQRAADAGHAGEEAAALIKVLRSPA